MAERKAIAGAGVVAAIGPYSPGLLVDGWLYCSGQIPLDPATGEMVGGGIEAEARQVLANVGAGLAAAGLSPTDVVKSTIFLLDLGDFATVNRLYGEVFVPPYPARSTVQVAALPRGARLEIEVVARARR